VAAFDWDSNACFVCGSSVPGLHVRFAGDTSAVVAETTIGAPYQGFEGLVHGGILAGLVDDAMWHVIHQQHEDFPVTAELTVRYRRPVHIGERLTVRGELVSYRPRLMVAKAEVTNADGAVLVTAQGRFMPVKAERHA